MQTLRRKLRSPKSRHLLNRFVSSYSIMVNFPQALPCPGTTPSLLSVNQTALVRPQIKSKTCYHAVTAGIRRRFRHLILFVLLFNSNYVDVQAAKFILALKLRWVPLKRAMRIVAQQLMPNNTNTTLRSCGTDELKTSTFGIISI